MSTHCFVKAFPEPGDPGCVGGRDLETRFSNHSFASRYPRHRCPILSDSHRLARQCCPPKPLSYAMMLGVPSLVRFGWIPNGGSTGWSETSVTILKPSKCTIYDFMVTCAEFQLLACNGTQCTSMPHYLRNFIQLAIGQRITVSGFPYMLFGFCRLGLRACHININCLISLWGSWRSTTRVL